ncbi:hypothetical protein [Methyloglobulus sp.]|uniref:hypothetical protein n=1 Tax=Methyloglobulus sp. TaxID=2518622 RepID=UPI0032B70A69
MTEFGDVLISTNPLNTLLMNESGSYVSEEAIKIDELIFYFVEEHAIDLPEDELRTLLLTEVI